MPNATYPAAAILVAWITLSGCCGSGTCRSDTTASEPVASEAIDEITGRPYAMTFIKTGPLTSPTQEQQAEAMQGHFANMQRLAADGTLLIAGPLADPKSDPAHRGIFVFDADTAQKGKALAATDPAAQMGVFEMDTYLLKTDAPLTELTRLENEYEQRRLSDEDVPDEWVGRMYIMASAPYSKELHEQVHGAEGVLITAKLIKDKRDHRVFLWLDAPNAQLARDLLPQAEWTLHGWYGSPTLVELPGLNTDR